MKKILLPTVLLVFSPGMLFAQNAPGDGQKSADGPQPSNPSAYKSSPRLSYHSNKPNEDGNVLGNLKPMLDQTLGNNKGNPEGGMAMPNSGTYRF